MSILDFFLVAVAVAGVGLRTYLVYTARRPAAAAALLAPVAPVVHPAPKRTAPRPVLRLVPCTPRGFGKPVQAA